MINEKTGKNILYSEAEFLDVRVFLFAIHCHLYQWILLLPPPLPLSKSDLKLVCYVNIRKPQV